MNDGKPAAQSWRQKQELVGQVLRERHRWDDTALIEVQFAEASYPETVKVTAPAEDIERNATYRFYGRWTNHQKYGVQFVAQSFVAALPADRESTLDYLCSRGQGFGIGRGRAALLWDTLGESVLQQLREDPAGAWFLAGIRGWTVEQAKQLAEVLNRDAHIEAAQVELTGLLKGMGFPRTTAKKAIAEWGNAAAGHIRRSAYILMRFRGCGFAATDKLYLHLGRNPAALKRQALAAWYSVAKSTEGHTWFGRAVAEHGIREKVAGAAVREDDAIRLAVRARMLTEGVDANGTQWIGETKVVCQEERIARCVAVYRRQEGVCWPWVEEIEGISDHQGDELAKALTGRLGVLAGSPGTGKTTAAAGLIKSLIEQDGADSIAICAPTGKAAVRLTEGMQSRGIDLRARTIHSTLGIGASDEGDGWGFQHHQGNPLPKRWIVVDEVSMCDTMLMAALLSACPKDAHILLIGDPGQLPPVGAGAPLRDLLAGGVAQGELTEIRRNGGSIVRVCAAIKRGQRWKPDLGLDLPAGRNLVCRPAMSPERQIEQMLAAIEQAQQRGHDPIWDVQPLAAVNAKSPLSRRLLNEVMQAEHNSAGRRAGDNPFCVGDKIVCTKNGFLPLLDESNPPPDSRDGKVFVANGELAEVVDVEPKRTVAKLENPARVIVIPRGESKADGEEEADDAPKTGCSWDLGYVLSCHKSQGSEWPVVLTMLDTYPGAMRLCSREWIYTAISRAKTYCELIGLPETAFAYCKNQSLRKRKTFLRELLTGEVGYVTPE